MENKIAIIRSLLNTLGYGQEAIDLGVDALNGRKIATTCDDEIMTPRQLCDRLTISETTLWRLRPPFLKVGGRKRFSWSEVRAFLANSDIKHPATVK